METSNTVWASVKAALCRVALVTEDTGDGLTLRVGLRGGAAHDVDVELGRGAGRDWVVLRAAVAPASEIDPWEALAHNGTLAVGALCANDDVVTLRHVAPLAANDNDPALILRLMAQEAARLRAAVSARVTAAATHVFANFGE